MDHALLLRLSAFFGLFVLLAALERFWPRRRLSLPRGMRWLTNLSIVALDTLTLRALAILVPLLAIGAALDAQARGWGLFNRTDWPAWVEVALAMLALDLALWVQHLATHKIPLLWRLHRVHHADRDFDVTTGIRFHPVEIALSMLLKIGLVYLLGAAALAVLLFEVLLNAAAMFTHANLRLPVRVDAVLRHVLVTPDMHRVHHSVHRTEHDSNYGFFLSLWDRLFRTYQAQPRDGHEAMTIGLEWQDDSPARLGWSLALPFRSK